MSNPNAPFYPIIFLRGFAMTHQNIDDAVADPFNGFNQGSAVFRATTDRDKVRKFIFESPVVRLGSDFGYKDVFDHGYDIVDPDWDGKSLFSRSIIIFRYYDQASTTLGGGRTPEIPDFARQLSELILRVRDLVCANRTESDLHHPVSPSDFRCYLVAHSMGGLICRTLLQNPKYDTKKTAKYVDKAFTYGTPHNGVEISKINVPNLNIPDLLGGGTSSNFNRDKMADFLNVKELYNAKGSKNAKRVDWLPQEFFPTDRFFCMVGTNRCDYEEVMGLSRTFVGHGSDGLVRIENATLWGVKAGDIDHPIPCPRAYAYRSHSGNVGLVNSEETYQNLIRFLFGTLRVDIWLDIDGVPSLPLTLQEKEKNGATINALYEFEILAAPRGKPWYLTRRTVEEDSAACRSHQDLLDAANTDARQVYLSTVFLDSRWRVNLASETLAYGLTLNVRVPDYEVDNRLWLDEHFEGGSLFNGTAVVRITPPHDGERDWDIDFTWEHQPEPNHWNFKLGSAGAVGPIPVVSQGVPGIKGSLRFIVSAWNA